MNLAILLPIILTLVILILSVKKLIVFKFDTRVIVRIGVVAVLASLISIVFSVLSDETNIYTQYLKDYGLDVYKIQPGNRNYLDYMLSFTKGGDVKEILISALSCTLTYEYIGKTFKKESGDKLSNNYYGPWIGAYEGKEFEKSSVDSCKFLDRICENIAEKEQEKLIEIFLQSCEHEMNFILFVFCHIFEFCNDKLQMVKL